MNELSTLLCTRAQNPISSHLKIPVLAVLPSLSCITSFTLLIGSFPSIGKHAFISLIISKNHPFFFLNFLWLLPHTSAPMHSRPLWKHFVYLCHHFLIPCSLWTDCSVRLLLLHSSKSMKLLFLRLPFTSPQLLTLTSSPWYLLCLLSSIRHSWLFPLPWDTRGFPGGSDSKESACQAGDLGSIPGLGRPPRGYSLHDWATFFHWDSRLLPEGFTLAPSPSSISLDVSLLEKPSCPLYLKSQLSSQPSAVFYLHSSCHHLIHYMVFFFIFLLSPIDFRFHKTRDFCLFCSFVFPQCLKEYLETTWLIVGTQIFII